MSDTRERQALAAAKEIRERAAHWVMERRETKLWTDEQQRSLDTWLSEAPAHLLAFWRLQAALEKSDRLPALARPCPREGGSRKKTMLRPILFRLSAAGLAAVVLTFLAASEFSLKSTETAYATQVGGRETIRLADGSSIELNTDTRIRVNLTPDYRMVILERGEAAFSVHHNSNRPFVVLALGHRIIDLGTKFWVREDTGKLQVALMEGKAKFESADPIIQQHSVMLKPGDAVIATSQTMSVSRYSQRTLTSDLAWRSGMLVFNETPLADVVAEFNRYNRAKLDIGDPQVASLKIDGTFRIDNTRGLLEMVRHVLRLRTISHGDRTLVVH